MRQLRQTLFKMALVPESRKSHEDCLCYKGDHNCLSHQPTAVCFVIQEESEPSSGSVHSCGHEQIEKTVKCDLIVKYSQKVKVVRKAATAREVEINDMENSDSEVKEETEKSELLQNEKVHKNVDQMTPEIIVKDEDADSGTESVDESKDSLIMNAKVVVSDASVIPYI